MTCSNTTRSGIRRRWQPSGCDGSNSGCSGHSAANWTQTGSNNEDGSAGTGLHRLQSVENSDDRWTRACLLPAGTSLSESWTYCRSLLVLRAAEPDRLESVLVATLGVLLVEDGLD